MSWRRVALFLALAAFGAGCSAEAEKNQIDRLPANVSASSQLPYKVALVADQHFKEYKMAICSTVGKVHLQPALTEAITSVLAKNFRSVVVLDDLTGKTSDVDFLVFPTVAFSRGGKTGIDAAAKDSKGKQYFQDLRASIDLVFKDPQTLQIVSDFRREASTRHATSLGESLMMIAQLGNNIPGVGVFISGPALLGAVATLQSEANQCRDEAVAVLAQDAQLLSGDIRNSSAFTTAKTTEGTIVAAKVASAAVKPPPEAKPLPPSVAERRVALVIGNSEYQHAPHLATPSKDAAMMAKTLETLGFTLVGGSAQTNLDKDAFDRALQNFGDQLHNATIGLFYYAGDGMQVRGENYLVPTSANPAKESDVDFQMIDAQVVLHVMQDGGARLNVLILDACRNSPFGGVGARGTESGLVQMQAPEGTLIGYAAQPGTVTAEASGDGSPYTEALVQAVQEPGLNVFRVFNEVGVLVKNKTGGAQEPWMSSSPIEGNFYFAGPPRSDAATTVAGSVN